ncbi:mitochondrial ribosomal protein L27-domain-containing protein [Schizothecium vesticola]|uniref:Mitochondrial ribosomal protein L27-domain-containing protein n=1 Tax=Schizothecium vesticola TaxID=314040 RepID=A0AA40K2C2_9PEZI|nr:mitochondrial ribosomal protein L27-domain-containing protein [Schizothecium vesticola]
MQPTRILQGLRFRKQRLTTKDVNKGFYKGTRTGNMGRHTSFGGFVIEWNKVRTYACPPLDGFKLTPFVTEAKPKVYGEYPGERAGPRSAEAYLARWKAENGLD